MGKIKQQMLAEMEELPPPAKRKGLVEERPITTCPNCGESSVGQYDTCPFCENNINNAFDSHDIHGVE